MQTNPDYYTSARTLATHLFERGEFEWSRQIEDAIAGGSTSTEILMMLRHTLRLIITSEVATPEETTAGNALIAKLNEVLA
jgi:hypothetical protein